MPVTLGANFMPDLETLDLLRKFAIESHSETAELQGHINDVVVGMTAIILDLYRTMFQLNLDTKAEALSRLSIQEKELRDHAAGLGAIFLNYVINNLKSGKLDAASLTREPPAGSA
jgi:hypothetical protein